MRKATLLITLLILTSCGVKIPLSELHTLEPIKAYETSNDFLAKKPMTAKLGVFVMEKSKQHITTKGIFNLDTGKINKMGESAWAIEYKGENYFSLGYSDDVNHWNSYAKFDIEGKYCAIIIDENSPSILNSTSVTYGGGISGFLLSESRKWGKNWKDKNGNKKKLLFIDNEDVKNKFIGRNPSSHGNYLTKQQFQKILHVTGTAMSDEKIKDIEFEKILELIKTANKQ